MLRSLVLHDADCIFLLLLRQGAFAFGFVDATGGPLAQLSQDMVVLVGVLVGYLDLPDGPVEVLRRDQLPNFEVLFLYV